MELTWILLKLYGLSLSEEEDRRIVGRALTFLESSNILEEEVGLEDEPDFLVDEDDR